MNKVRRLYREERQKLARRIWAAASCSKESELGKVTFHFDVSQADTEFRTRDHQWVFGQQREQQKWGGGLPIGLE